jgi:hypothetical protein
MGKKTKKLISKWNQKEEKEDILYLRERDRLEGRPSFLEDLRFFSLLAGNGMPRQP